MGQSTEALYHNRFHTETGKCGDVSDNQDDSFNSSKAEVFEALGHPTRIRLPPDLSGQTSPYSGAQAGGRLGEQRPPHLSSGKDEGPRQGSTPKGTML